MSVPPQGAIDCDVHIALPGTRVLVPYLDEYWREHVLTRGLDRDNLDTVSYPPGSPLSARPDWRPPEGNPGTDFDLLRRAALDGFGARYAIANCLHGAQVIFSEDLSAAFCRAINDWIAREWLDRDTRLRASIVIPMHSPELSALEIERVAPDRRFVQVLMLVMGELPPGRRPLWPIYQAAERHDLPVGLHAGSSFRHAPTSLGWPSYYLEDYVLQSSSFAGALNSLITEGVFVQFPRLKVVLLESGVTWLPNYLWRATKTWRAARIEVPWNKRSPAELVREHVRLTIQPFDAPPTAGQVERIAEEIGSEEVLLFATDFPHWHFEGQNAVPDGLPEAFVRKMMIDNPLATYPRLQLALP
ncbi:MAG: amidohydrolase family protein [Alphaproteobacteria bacterium]|nr:amidohydrolase family protein [Alphaproteobacteria bacterium]